MASRFVLVATLILPSLALAADPVFSGPQAGEKLAAFKVKTPFGKEAGKEFELNSKESTGPVLIVFFHEKDRPAFNLSNALLRFAVSRKKSGLKASVVFLTDDMTATTNWLNLIQRYFPEGVDVGVSPDGIEGPGAYGLNRNVKLTVLVGKDGKVTDNFALVQPSTQADGPKILKAVIKNIGGGDVPDITQFARLPRAKPTQRPKPGTRPKDNPSRKPNTDRKDAPAPKRD